MLAALFVGQLHHIIIMTRFVVTPYMKHVDQSRMILRNLLVALNPLKFALEGPLILKILAGHDFDSTIHACDGTAKVDLTVSSPADATEDLEIGYQGAVGSLGYTQV